MENKNFPGVGDPQKNNIEEHHVSSEPLAFNVMPRVRSEIGAGMVNPVIKNDEPSTNGAKAGTGSSIFSKYKLFIIAVAVLLIAGPIVYYVVSKIGGKGYEPENILIDNPTAEGPTGNATTTDPSLFTTPEEWRASYFSACDNQYICGDEADPDLDGLGNKTEFELQTDPNNKDSDNDGLADGDEVAVFSSDPLNARTAGNTQYQDADYFKGGYSLSDDKPMTAEQLDALGRLMTEKGLHEPTIRTLNDYLTELYHFNVPASGSSGDTATSSLDSSIDQSAEAKQDRDAQRTNIIKSIGIALTKYYDDYRAYPATSDFMEMYGKVKVYLRTALNPKDPINKEPYVYSYSVNSKQDDFTLSYYSETIGQVIRKHAADALKDRAAEEAATYDDRRETDLESLRTALLLYSHNNVTGDEEYIFPTVDKYKTALVPAFINQMPKDPKTGLDYEYQVSESLNSFTLKAAYENPRSGTTGYLCNQEECREY